jgi:5-methylcytosine-specific restriction endonuclease McrA
MRTCTLDGCDLKHYAKGLCGFHWRQDYRINNQEKIKANRARIVSSGKSKEYSAKHNAKPERKAGNIVYSKQYREANKEKIRLAHKEWLANNPDYRKQYNESNRKLLNVKEGKRRTKKKDSGTFYITKKEISRLYSRPCFFCGSVERIHLDHIVPIAKGGRHSIGNLQPLCYKCNISKGSKFFYEWKMYMKNIDEGRGSNR